MLAELQCNTNNSSQFFDFFLSKRAFRLDCNAL